MAGKSKKGTRWTAIWDEKRKRWKLNAQVKGVRKSFYSSKPGRAGAIECQQAAAHWVDAAAPNESTRVEDICASFLDEIKAQRSPSSSHWAKQEYICRVWIIPRIGKKKIGSIQDVGPLQKILYDAFYAGMSKRTIVAIKSTINAIFKHARLKKATIFHPEGLAIPRYAPTRERPALSFQDVKTLMLHDETLYYGRKVSELYVNAWRLAVVLGCRPGEIIGLKHEDIDGEYLTIRRAINARGETTPGKNENASRQLKLPAIALEILEKQKALLKRLNISSDYVFPGKTGEHATQNGYLKRWHVYRDFHEMKPGTTPYSMRNTAISAYKAIPKPLLGPVIGHSEEMDTWGIYGREMEGDLDKVAGAMDQIMQEIMADEDEEDGDA